MRILSLLLLIILQPWLPRTRAAAIERPLLKITASGVTLSPTMAPPSPVSVDECGLQQASGPVACAIEDSSLDSRLLNASNVHHTPEGLPDTANTQHLQSGISSSTIKYAMISTIFGGLSLLLALVWGPFAKSYWDKLQNTNTSSSPASSDSELELGASGNQAVWIHA